MRTREGGRIVDEAPVIARVRAGDPEAYAELVRAHTGIALRAARALGAGADAEDVVQQAFVKACALGRFRERSPVKPWLPSIVADETRNTVRTAARQRTLAGREAAFMDAEPLLPESADPAVATLETERRAGLLSALEQLSAEHRLVVTCRYLLEMDESETAEALGRPRGTVPDAAMIIAGGSGQTTVLRAGQPSFARLSTLLQPTHTGTERVPEEWTPGRYPPVEQEQVVVGLGGGTAGAGRGEEDSGGGRTAEGPVVGQQATRDEADGGRRVVGGAGAGRGACCRGRRDPADTPRGGPAGSRTAAGGATSGTHRSLPLGLCRPERTRSSKVADL